MAFVCSSEEVLHECCSHAFHPKRRSPASRVSAGKDAAEAECLTKKLKPVFTREFIVVATLYVI